MRKPIARNLTYGIAEQLGQAIVTGVYDTTHGFPIEAELCKEFAASRSVLREAVKMLTAKGLLAARPRQGTWVEPEERWNLLDPDVLRWLLERKFSLQRLEEFTEVRLAIEPLAAALAAGKSNARTTGAIRHAIERMRSAERGEDDPLASDIAFHVAVLHASGNRFFMQLEGLIEAALRISIRLTNQFKGVVGDVAAHKKVLDAITAGNPGRASLAMEAILLEVMALIEAARKKTKPPKTLSPRAGLVRKSA